MPATRRGAAGAAMGNDWLQFFCTATWARVKINTLIHEKSVGYLVTAGD
jgi:hypothetical protein